MGVGNSRPQAEVDKLMQQLASLPKATTEHSSEPQKKTNDNWKRKSVAVARGGRVNRTKGK
jgi:hypothetical protein